MIADWLYQWGPPNGGTIFSGFDGLATVVMAAMSLETFNVFAFEKDERIWRAAIEEVTNFGQSLDKKMDKFQKSVKASASIQSLAAKAIKNPKAITNEEVPFPIFDVFVCRRKNLLLLVLISMMSQLLL